MVGVCHVISSGDKVLDQVRKRGFGVREDLPGRGPRHLDPTRYDMQQALLCKHQLLRKVFALESKDLGVHGEGAKGT